MSGTTYKLTLDTPEELPGTWKIRVEEVQGAEQTSTRDVYLTEGAPSLGLAMRNCQREIAKDLDMLREQSLAGALEKQRELNAEDDIDEDEDED